MGNCAQYQKKYERNQKIRAFAEYLFLSWMAFFIGFVVLGIIVGLMG